ncbi:MAG TPA: hypothetical protein VIY90_21245 [Steroidobacteraceae bacterium]
MLFQIDIKQRLAKRVAGEQLSSFGLDERGLQEILFRSLDRLLPDEELLLIAQSRRWQEEPDLLALDEKGRLFIFELKVWEARSENLLQVLRYGQLFGTYGYEDLDARFRRYDDSGRSLAQAHAATFGVSLAPATFNQEQVFIVMVNGLDFRTRQAIQYWRSRKLDVRPWIYRIYKGLGQEVLLEMARFAVEDNPYEDATTGSYILNTNFRNSPADHQEMLAKKKAAAYLTPWKHKIEQLSKGDTVFLYQSGTGIVAYGYASGKLEKAPAGGDLKQSDEEYFMKLNKFQIINLPISAAQIRQITGNSYSFRGTMFSIDADSSAALVNDIRKRPSQNLGT